MKTVILLCKPSGGAHGPRPTGWSRCGDREDRGVRLYKSNVGNAPMTAAGWGQPALQRERKRCMKNGGAHGPRPTGACKKALDRGVGDAAPYGITQEMRRVTMASHAGPALQTFCKLIYVQRLVMADFGSKKRRQAPPLHLFTGNTAACTRRSIFRRTRPSFFSSCGHIRGCRRSPIAAR